MSWWKYALGGFGALFAAGEAHAVITRTKGQKAKVGDLAFVQLIAIDSIPANPNSRLAIEALRASVGSATNVRDQGALTLIPVKIAAIGPIPPTMTAGGGFHQLRGTVQMPTNVASTPIEVEFSSQAVQTLKRNGVEIQDGPSRLF